MSRQDEVLNALEQLTNAQANDAHSQNFRRGFTAEEVARILGIWRSNCSADLNALAKTGRILKISGRPTRFILASANDRQEPERPAVTSPSRNVRSAESLPKPLHRENHLSANDGDPFDLDSMTYSLKEPMELAKAALRYPPRGMNILLLGETGVGKSLLARRMYEFAVRTEILPQEASFVSFNCAEYSNNPQVLLDHLFGHVRGAFTGAIGDKVGLVESANGGVLFLDEVHRLPPEGQEMLFELLDHGVFRRMGESNRTRRVNLRVFAATTEPPESVLLATFRRRIPMTIQLPSLRDWYVQDRIRIIRRFFLREAKTLGCTIRVTHNAWMRLLYARFPANIGGLENTVRLSCARVFAQYLGSDPTQNETSFGPMEGHSETPAATVKELVITPLDLENLDVGSSPQSDLQFTSQFRNSSEVVFRVDDAIQDSPEEAVENVAYSKLDQLAKTLFDLGFDIDEIGYILERQFLHRRRQEPGLQMLDELRRFVGDQFYESLRRAWGSLEQELNLHKPGAVFLRIAMHLFGLSRGAVQNPVQFYDADMVKAPVKDSKTFLCAKRLLESFADKSGIQVTSQEIAVIANMLNESVVAEVHTPKLLLIMRGNGIANALADTAISILGLTSFTTINVPLEEDWTSIKRQMLQEMQRLQPGDSVVIFTDIGEILQYVQENRGLVGDAETRVVFRPDVTAIIEAVMYARDPHRFSRWTTLESTGPTQTAKIQEQVRLEVLACCLTGRGTARAVKRLIQSSLPADLRDSVTIQPMEVGLQKGGQLQGIANSDTDHKIIAAVGSVDPQLPEVPFLSLEEILKPGGVRRLVGLIRLSGNIASANTDESSLSSSKPDEDLPNLYRTSPAASSQEDVFQSYVFEMLERDLVYVNPRRVLQASLNMLSRICERTEQGEYSRELSARFILHMGYVVERGIQGNVMKNPYVSVLKQRFQKIWSLLEDAWRPIEDVFRLPPDANELAYLFEMLFPDLSSEVTKLATNTAVSPRRR